MRRLLLVLICLMSASFRHSPVNNPVDLTGYFQLETVYLYCNESDFNAINQNPRENIYIPVSVKNNTATWDSVKMRIRGDSSREHVKKSLKLKFADDQPYKDGITTLNLNFQELDHSFIRQALASMVMIKTGYPCFSAQPVVLYINDHCKGIYLNVENVDKRFLSKRNYSPDNNLYKAAKDSACLSIHDSLNVLWEKKTNEDSSFEDLASLIQLLHSTPEEKYYDLTKKIFDYDKMVHIIALNMLVGNSSTYYHNYYMYHDLKSDKWTMFPWDMDNTFFQEDAQRLYQTGNHSDNYDSEMPSNLFFERAIACKPILNDIIGKVTQLHETIFNKETLFPVIDTLKMQLKPFIALNESNPLNVLNAFDIAIDNVKGFIGERYDSLMYQFNNSPTSFRLATPQFEKDKMILKWQRSTDPSGNKISYIVRYGTDKFYETGSTEAIVTDTFLVINNKLKKGFYYWKVYATDGEFRIAGFDNSSYFRIEE